MATDGLSTGEPLGDEAFDDVCRQAVLACSKWNVTSGGRCTLSRFPLLLDRALHAKLSAWAVALDAEARAAEEELRGRPSLHRALGLPYLLRLALRRPRLVPGPRYARFDFHPTAEGGFVVTEGNLDVAGGLNEASGVTKLFVDRVVGVESGGDPAVFLAKSLREAVGPGATVGCLHVTNFADDHQVVRFLAKRLEDAGLDPVLFGPSQLVCAGDHAAAVVGGTRRRMDAVFRFFPAEWFPRLDPRSMWWRTLAVPGTRWVNPVTSVFTQSKRFPLVWPCLRAPLPTWKKLLPETRSPRDGGEGEGEWVFKPALAHEGYRVAIAGVTDRAAYAALRRRARLFPWRWAAQRRFAAVALSTPSGPRYPCVGVYVVDGRAAGLYGRLAERPLIDGRSVDAVVLLRRDG